MRFSQLMKGSIFFLFLFTLASCQRSLPERSEIVVLSINDIHGNFDNMARLSAYVKEIRSTYEYVVVLDAGDRFTGNPISDFHAQKNFPIVDIENAVGVDVATIGNHEFDGGLEVLRDRMKEANFPWIVANVGTKGTVLPSLEPFKTLKVGPYRVTVLGLLGVDARTGRPETLDANIQGLTFEDPVMAAMRYRSLRAKSHVFIALTHIGLQQDRRLADSMPGLDLIVGGHSHDRLLVEEPVNGVAITHTGSNLDYMGKTVIHLEKGKVVKVENELVDLRAPSFTLDKEDSVIIKKVMYFTENSDQNRVVARLKNDILGAENLGLMMTDAILEIPGVDLAFMNCGGVRIDCLFAGDVRLLDVQKLSPFNNYILTVQMKASDIRNMIKLKYNSKKACLMPVSGIRYEVVMDKNDSSTLSEVYLFDKQGKPLSETRYYTVGMNNYLQSKFLDASMKATPTGISVVDNVLDFLSKHPDVDYRNDSPRIIVR